MSNDTYTLKLKCRQHPSPKQQQGQLLGNIAIVPIDTTSGVGLLEYASFLDF